MTRGSMQRQEPSPIGKTTRYIDFPSYLVNTPNNVSPSFHAPACKLGTGKRIRRPKCLKQRQYHEQTRDRGVATATLRRWDMGQRDIRMIEFWEMETIAPEIYVRPATHEVLSWRGRAVALAAAMACLGVLLIAAKLNPSRSGVGSHRQLGLQECQFESRTGLPCL